MNLMAAAFIVLYHSAAFFLIVLVHAFQRSVGTGTMVLLIPAYNVVYGVGQFRHPYKGVVLAGWLGGFVLGIVLRAVALAAG